MTPRSEMPRWPGGPELRIGDAEREAAVSALGEHYASGRLSKDEYDERAAAAWAARTSSALRPLFADLPAPHPFTAGRAGGVPRVSPTVAPRTAPKSRSRVPFVPVLLVTIGLAILLDAAWLVFVVLGVWWLTRSGRHGCHPHR